MALIRHAHYSIGTGGGPAGYLLNLQQAIEEYGTGQNITLEVTCVPPPAELLAAAPPHRHSLAERAVGKLKRMTASLRPPPPTMDEPLRLKENMGWYGCSWVTRDMAARILECDLLVLHDTYMAAKVARFFPQEAAKKTILITHAPAWRAWQQASMMRPEEPMEELYARPEVTAMVQEEKEAMQAMRGVAWPFPESMEGYPEWQELADGKQVESFFAETGVPCPAVNSDPLDMRRRWGIEEGRKIALFIGRPHPHKGFDRFVDFADLCRRQGRTDWVFVQAGGSASLKRDLSAVRQVGWITDNGAAYMAADLVLVPNHYSYLDIGALEGLALGARMALAPTGGHAALLKACPGIPAIPSGSPEEVWPALEQTAERYASEPAHQQALREIWSSRFTPECFLKNHIALAGERLAHSR